MSIIGRLTILSALMVNTLVATAKPTVDFQTDFSLVELGQLVFDLKLPIKHRSEALKTYISHPMMEVAFRRYSDTRRPPENRVDAKIYTDFVGLVWQRKFAAIAHPRMKYVGDLYRWGIDNLPAIVQDTKTVKSQIADWLKTATKKIPFGTPAAEEGSKPVKLVFLFDPGGSYPWVEEDDAMRYIFFDVLQLRGIEIDDKTAPVSESSFNGFLTHELFHQFQADNFDGLNKADWLLQIAVSEGSAMLIGNNASDKDQTPYDPKEKVLLSGRALREWQETMPKVCGRISAFLALYEQWKKKAPTDDEYYKTISQDGWIATPSNDLLFGDVYRVGAQMLMDIKAKRGLKVMYTVLGNSAKLLNEWNGTSRCTSGK